MPEDVFDPNALGAGIRSAIAENVPYFGDELVADQGSLRHRFLLGWDVLVGLA